MRELPVGQGKPRLRLWDNCYRLIWDSAMAKTPAYQHISTWVNATIDAEGERWSGIFYRCPEGIKRWSREDLTIGREGLMIKWPENPLI
jgi:hypothetical protein